MAKGTWKAKTTKINKGVYQSGNKKSPTKRGSTRKGKPVEGIGVYYGGGSAKTMSLKEDVFLQEEMPEMVAQRKMGKFVVEAIMPVFTPKPENQLTPFEKMEIVINGVSKTGLEQLKSKSALDYDRLAKMLSTTKVTLINKKGDEKFNSSLSEKILSVADVYSYGYEVFEDEQRFNNWILSPIRALGGKAPYEIMDNQFGREEVKNIIGRIAYGVYS